jgi:hypothetical protein
MAIHQSICLSEVLIVAEHHLMNDSTVFFSNNMV